MDYTRSGRFTVGKENRYPLCMRLGRPRSRSGWIGKISSPLGFELRTVLLVASRYTITQSLLPNRLAVYLKMLYWMQTLFSVEWRKTCTVYMKVVGINWPCCTDFPPGIGENKKHVLLYLCNKPTNAQRKNMLIVVHWSVCYINIIIFFNAWVWIIWKRT
jgi:hypothetical protein